MFARLPQPGLPAPLAPLREPGAFFTQSGVVTVTRIDHGVVAVDPEHPAFQAAHERIELRRSCCPPRAAREQAVT